MPRTTVSVDVETAERLADRKGRGDSYDDVITWMLDLTTEEQLLHAMGSNEQLERMRERYGGPIREPDARDPSPASDAELEAELNELEAELNE